MQNQENRFNNQQNSQTQEANSNMYNPNSQYAANGIYNQNPQYAANGIYNQNPQFNDPAINSYLPYNQAPEQIAKANAAAQSYFMGLEKKARQKQDLKKLGNFTGFALLSYIFIQNVFAIFLELFGLNYYYYASSTFSKGYDIFVVIISMVLSFSYFGIKMNKVSGVKDSIVYDAPKDKKQLALAIFSGLGFCMVANYITVYFVIFLSLFGVSLSSPEVSTSSLTISDIILTYLQVVIVAAIAEEISLRGFTMGNLKQFGVKFAVFASAVIFGLMHANFVQAPFALIVGLALGYLTIKTGSIWTGILIHAINNFISISVSYRYYFMDENVLNLLYTALTYALIIVGAICFAQFTRRNKTEAPSYFSQQLMQHENLSFAQMCRSYFGAPVMVIALIFFISLSFSYVSFG